MLSPCLSRAPSGNTNVYNTNLSRPVSDVPSRLYAWSSQLTFTPTTGSLFVYTRLSTIVALKHADPSPITRVTKGQVQKAHAK